MAINYKPEQKAIIDENSKNQLVSASAGSGKTTIMIQKIIELITLHHYNIKNILVLTYTKASAEEMKQKLISKIYEEVKNNPKLLEQVDQVALSDISTLHSFFQKVIKKYFMVLGINPSFELLDENAGAKYKKIAEDEAIREYSLTHQQQFENLLEVFGASRTTDTIKSLVATLNNFLLAVTDKNNWCKNVATKLYDEKDLGISILNQELCDVAKFYAYQFTELQNIANSYEEEKIVAELNKVLGVLTVIKPGVENFEKNCLNLCSMPTMYLPRKCETVDLKEKITFVKDNMKKFIAKVKTWQFCNMDVLKKQLDETKPVVQALCELTLLTQEKYAEIKKQKNVFDFDDLEKFMLELIKNPKICDELRNSYDKIFVDEYQDANRIQEKILTAICKDNNRFMVGDVKQSIYGFRQAEPDIFLETMQNFEHSEKSVVGFLNYNFRSHKKILNFVNIVFSKIMTAKTGKIDYNISSLFKWDEKYKDVENQNLKQVEIDIIKRPQKQEKQSPEKMYSILDEKNDNTEYLDAELEAFLIAKKINELLDKKIYVAKEDFSRKIEYKDITILLRSRGSYLTPFSKILTGLGIPLYANTNESLFCDGDVQMLMNLTKLAVNFNDDVALVSVMHSVLGGNFSYDELIKIRLNYNSKAKFFECVENYKIKDEIFEKIVLLKNMLSDFSISCEENGAYNTYNDIIDKTNFKSYILKKKDGLQKLENIKKFVENFLTNGYNFDLIGFIEYVDNNIDSISAPDFLGGENCVSITTMHSSKGLEYPVVIMANCGQDFDKSAMPSAITLNQNFGLGMKYYDTENREEQTSMPLEVIKKVNKDNDFAEKLRLLYVAMTRPQNHLIVVGTTDKPFEVLVNDFSVKRQKTYLNLIVGALKEDEVDAINSGRCVSTEEYDVFVVDAITEKDFNVVKQTQKFEVDEGAVEEFKKYFDYEYKGTCQKLKVKNSVTALRKLFEEKIEITKEEHSQNNLALLGTTYHKILELIDFNAVQNVQDVQNFLKSSKVNLPLLDQIDENKVFKAICLIKEFNAKKYLKEQEFVMSVPENYFDENFSENNEILVKGVVDLIILGEKNVLIDYKFTQETDENAIIATYKMQIDLYQKALEMSGIMHVSDRYLLLLNQEKLLKI